MTTVNLTAASHATTLLSRDIGAGAGFLFMRAETMDKVAKQSTWRVSVAGRCCRLNLNQGIHGANSASELVLFRLQLLLFFVPHQLDVTNRACVVEQQQEVLEEFQILLELTPERATQ